MLLLLILFIFLHSLDYLVWSPIILDFDFNSKPTGQHVGVVTHRANSLLWMKEQPNWVIELYTSTQFPVLEFGLGPISAEFSYCL